MPRSRVSAKQQARWEHEALERKFAKLQGDYDKLKAREHPPKPGDTHAIDGETAFPIYLIAVEYACDGEHNPKYPLWHEELPEGRIWGGSAAHYHMFREVPTFGQVRKHLSERWEAIVKKAAETGKHTNPTPAVLSCQFLRWETWCLTWFSHYTFDTGQTDAEALASFDRFVDRMERLNHEETTYEPYVGEDGNKYCHKHLAYCLMGAEDRYRWCGSEDGSPDKRTAPPCRCKHCKEQGVIRIGH